MQNNLYNNWFENIQENPNQPAFAIEDDIFNNAVPYEHPIESLLIATIQQPLTQPRVEPSLLTNVVDDPEEVARTHELVNKFRVRAEKGPLNYSDLCTIVENYLRKEININDLDPKIRGF